MALLIFYIRTIYYLKADFMAYSMIYKCVQINRLLPLVLDSKSEKLLFSLYILNKDISFNIP